MIVPCSERIRALLDSLRQGVLSRAITVFLQLRHRCRHVQSVKMAPTQALISSYPVRLGKYGNPLYTPVIPTATAAPTSRTTKRGTTIINYADDAFDDDDFDDSEGQRRPTGLRSLRRDDFLHKEGTIERLGKEIRRPVEVQGIFRDWMTRRTVKPTYAHNCLVAQIVEAKMLTMPCAFRTDQQLHSQSQLPLTLIPIRIDIDVPAAPREAPFPLTHAVQDAGYHSGMPPFQRPEPSPAYKIRDVFLWNLHESLYTPDDFAQVLAKELDLPNRLALALTISNQIRTQLEEYAGVAMHPLFHNQSKPAAQADENVAPPAINGISTAATPQSSGAPHLSPPASTTPGAVTPIQNGSTPLPNGLSVHARASPVPADPIPNPTSEPIDPEFDPFLNQEDLYRCVINLTVSLSSRLYSDKFEWSLLHPPGVAEIFARQTCSDLGLSGEWALAISHAIYEAVLRLKKEVCEGGMLLTGEVDNQAVRIEEAAGWRYDAEDFGAEWEPKLELLSKEEIEKREGDRERQLRRLRRETAKFSSTAGMMPSAREQEAQSRASYFDLPGGGGTDNETVNLGRGERSKKKRRFRSLSPPSKALGSPAEGSTGAGAGWGGAENKLQEYERQNWRCAWCLAWGTGVWAVRDGPTGPRVSLLMIHLSMEKTDDSSDFVQ